jgi:uncharacterized protein (TIGR02145 family)
MGLHNKIKNMKKLTLTFICTILVNAVLAQAPQGISHQAVIRDANNQLVTESPIGIQVSIIQETPEGTVVYSETHTPTSNANGLISFVIGQGTVVSGVFAEIDLSDGPYFIETKADPTGGTTYTITGTSQMLSVPYAFYAHQAAGLDEIIEMLIDAGLYRVRDVDGNVYQVVRIGEQVWMAENLKTTKYRNGTTIENPTGSSDWQNNTTGAYAWYNNDINWKDSYGALYNWHAVNNTNGLCPTGWHVPTDAEFTAMTNHLGGTSVAGGKMKSTRTVPDPHPRWESPNTGATNESNWSGLPGGYRNIDGTFNDIGNLGFWWSATEHSAAYAWSRFLYYGNGSVFRSTNIKAEGFSVRCLRD